MLKPLPAPPRSLRHVLLIALLIAGTSFALGCGDDEEGGTTDTMGGTDVASDQSGSDGTTSGIELSGDDATYRFTALELREPDVSLRIILNALIDVNIRAEPNDPLAVHVLFQLAQWDTASSPVSLQVAGGAGEADTTGAEVTFAFRADADVAGAPAEYREVDGKWKIQNDQTTTLLFPVIVQDATFMLPLRELTFDACYGNSASCSGTDQSTVFGTLRGGIIEAEADGIQVEIDDTTVLPLGDVLRDPKVDCAGDSDCPSAKVCGSESLCVRPTDMTIDGQPAFALEGRFVAETISFVP